MPQLDCESRNVLSDSTAIAARIKESLRHNVWS
jgi:hypothetical protein